MLNLLVKWLVSAISLLVVAYFVPGFHVNGFTAALIAAVAVGFVNGTIGAILRFFTWPIRFLTLGLFTLVINAAMLSLVAYFMKGSGFEIDGFVAALMGAFVLAVVSTILRWIVPDFNKKTEDGKK
jgi:putative membrane protein